MAGRRPRVRPLEPIWTEHEGEHVLVLRDRSGVCEQPLAVQPVIGFILSLCDGSRDEDAIRAALSAELKQAVEPAQLADILVVFGTDHVGGPGAITLTRQRYDTPFGPLDTDLPAVDAVAEALGQEAAFAEELHHRGEHSIELAAVWAASLLGDRRPPMLPVLCGSFFPYTNEDADPALDARLTAAVDALKRATAGRRVVAVAAGDLAHVGPAF